MCNSFVRFVFFALFIVECIVASPITRRGASPHIVPPINRFAGLTVTDISGQKQYSVADLVKGRSKYSLVVFLTHMADLTSFELAQQIVHYMPQLSDANINVVGISPGSTPESAKLFCEMTKFPTEKLFIDPTGASYKEMEFSQGFIPEAPVSPYFKLLPMLAGIGSPGTIQEVLRGYFGDQSTNPKWIRKSLRLVRQERFDVLGYNYQRPFELATVRLQNMVDVLGNWGRLAPEQTSLITQLGGAYLLDKKGSLLYQHKDQGILKYVDVKEAAAVCGVELV